MIRLARWAAMAIAVAAIVDPRVPMPRSERPVVRIVSAESRDNPDVAAALKDAGFAIDPSLRERVTVVLTDNAAGMRVFADTPIWALDTAPPAPNVSVTRATAPARRFPGQAVEVTIALTARGAAGRTTEVVLEQNGIPVAAAAHKWTEGARQWTTTVRYLPPTVAATSLRVRATTRGETNLDDNTADVGVPAARGPVRVLIVEASVSWPAVFVRRALEGEPAVAVSSLQRAAKSVATRAGAPPAGLTRSTLARYEAVVIGGPDELRASDLAALRWFVEQRGGLAIFIPDRVPAGRYVDLLGVSAFTWRALETPARVGAQLQASELLIPSRLPPAATILAAAGDTPVVFSARRGAGAVVVSGAVDAWRNRDAEYAAFWRRVLLANAATVPLALEVATEPSMVRPGERISVIARLRDLPEGDAIEMPVVSARVVAADARMDEVIRLWPTAEPGAYEGQWRAPTTGRYDVAVSAGELGAHATVAVGTSVARGSQADSEGLALTAEGSGGGVFPAAELTALVEAMKRAHPPQTVVRGAHPMRSPWWLAPFAGLLCVEWAVRRKRGLP